MTAYTDPLKAVAYLEREQAKIAPAGVPPASNAGPAALWRKVVDAKPVNSGPAQPRPLQMPGTVSALDAWRRAIAPAKA